MVEWTQVGDFFNQYAALFVLGALVLLWFIIRKVKQNRERKKQAKKAMELKDADEKKSEIQPPMPPVGHADWAARFDLRRMDREKQMDVIEKIVSVGSEIDSRSKQLDAQLKTDFEDRRTELQEVVKKKEQIREQGLKLAALYDKYQEREMHLVNIMQSIEYMMNRGGSQPPDGRA